MLEEERRASRESSLMMHRRNIRDANNPLELSEENFKTLFRIPKEIALVIIQGIESDVTRSRSHGLPVHITVSTYSPTYLLLCIQSIIHITQLQT